MKKILALVFLIGFFAVIAEAANLSNIEYPVSELGNCSSRLECKVFCDNPDNLDACIAFSEKKGFIKTQEAKKIRDIAKQPDVLDGPGSCKTPRECDAYCRIESNLDECLNYSVSHGYTTQEEANKVKEQSQKGGPGSCKSKDECDAFCKNPDNAEECFSFVEKEGKITKEEAEFLKERALERKQPTQRKDDIVEKNIDKEKITEVLKTQNGPGGCKTMQECNAYCSDFSHGEECIQFAVKNQIAPQEVLEKMKKMSEIKSGPGGCQGQMECDAFCSKKENRQTCFDFSKQNNLISPEELNKIEKEMAIVEKLERGEVGPGGCKGRQECDVFCKNPEHLEECINFAGKSGLLSPDNVKEMMGKTQEALEKIREMEMQFGGKDGKMPFEMWDVRRDEFSDQPIQNQMPQIRDDNMMPYQDRMIRTQDGMMPPMPQDGTIPSQEMMPYYQQDKMPYPPQGSGESYQQMPPQYQQMPPREGMMPSPYQQQYQGGMPPSGTTQYQQMPMPSDDMMKYQQMPPQEYQQQMPPQMPYSPQGMMPPQPTDQQIPMPTSGGYVPPTENMQYPPMEQPPAPTSYLSPLKLIGSVVYGLFSHMR